MARYATRPCTTSWESTRRAQGGVGHDISESEGAKFWLQVLIDLHNRGLRDILIACTDNLKGFTEAILSIFPSKCNCASCTKYATRSNTWPPKTTIKAVYRATNKEAAEDALLDLKEKLGKKHSRGTES